MKTSLDNVICKRRLDSEKGWVDWSGELTPVQRTALLNLFGYRVRQSTRQALIACFTDNCRRVKACGIMGRVEITDDGAGYCAGQDYPSEIAFVRKMLVASY